MIKLNEMVLKLMILMHECRDQEEVSVDFNSVAEERAWWQEKRLACW